MEDSNSFREMTEFMEATHDDLWDQLPGNGQVTLLVFREGELQEATMRLSVGLSLGRFVIGYFPKF